MSLSQSSRKNGMGKRGKRDFQKTQNTLAPLNNNIVHEKSRTFFSGFIVRGL